MSSNPLLEPSSLPFGVPPLDKVKAEHFLPAVKVAIEEARRELADIKANPAKPTFQNTLEALEFSGQTLSRVGSVFSNISGANSNDDIRAIEMDVRSEMVKYGNELMQDKDLFKRIKTVYDERASYTLTPEQSMFLEETYKGFVRSGALLDDDQKKRMREISEKMSELTTNYRNNNVKATAAYKRVVTDEAELAGVPERAKNLYKRFAEKEGLEGQWLIKLSPPPSDIMLYADNRALREEISRAQAGVSFSGEFDNRQNVLDIVALRHEKAQIMGYPNYAAYVLAERMAKTPEAVNTFLDRNEAIYKPSALLIDLPKVKDFAKAEDGLTDFQSWDFAYYSRKLTEKTFDLDLESLRPYFNLENVLEGVRIHAEKLFNIEMKETKDTYPVYDPSVKVYEVRDRANNEMIGIFYADYYAREGAKNGGAWMNTFRNRGIEDGENRFSLVTNVCNFAEPSAKEPTLLSLDDVRTVFHEFGHGLHALLAKGNYPSQTGTNVKWDFVELPSQLQENWSKKKEVLDTFATHQVTGEKLSAELIDKINAMETFFAAYDGQRQTFLARLDMKWHTTDPKTIKSVEELEDSVVATSGLFPRMAGTMSTRFGHLFAGGYAAGYYSYKWAEALEADVFELFDKKGLYDRDTAQRLRDTIYSQGGNKDPMDLFKDMMGREPESSALFRREGLMVSQKPQGISPTPPTL